jgi:DNA-directed RNA polymerase specialized sigma24 family protein
VAEDLAQDTLLEAWRHAQEWPGPEARRAWLAGIARHRCLRWARRRCRERARLIQVDAEPDAPVTRAFRAIADVTMPGLYHVLPAHAAQLDEPEVFGQTSDVGFAVW